MLEQALQSTITIVFLRALALVLGVGALVHIGNIAGLSGQAWASTPLLWRIMDIVLLGFNIVVGVGLWLKQPWGVAAFVIGIIALQLVPYTVFRQHFIQTAEHISMLNSMVAFWIVVLAALMILVVWRGSAA